MDKKRLLSELFHELRNHDGYHLGLGDIRLTLGRQEEIEAMFAELEQQLAEKDGEIEQLRDALTEQLDRRGFAFRGRCDAVPEDIERAFSAMGICTDEHRAFLAEQEKG